MLGGYHGRRHHCLEFSVRLCGDADTVEQSEKQMQLRAETYQPENDATTSLYNLGRNIDELVYEAPEFHS